MRLLPALCAVYSVHSNSGLIELLKMKPSRTSEAILFYLDCILLQKGTPKIANTSKKYILLYHTS